MSLSKKTETERAETQRVLQLREAGLISFNEAWEMLGLPPMPEVKWGTENTTGSPI